jgi:hypothetical protein
MARRAVDKADVECQARERTPPTSVHGSQGSPIDVDMQGIFDGSTVVEKKSFSPRSMKIVGVSKELAADVMTKSSAPARPSVAAGVILPRLEYTDAHVRSSVD